MRDSARSLHIIALRELARDGNAQAQAAVAAFEAQHPRDTAANTVFQLDARLDEVRAGLQSDDPETRRGAVLAMAKFGPRAAPAVPDLIQALADSASFVRERAINALLAIGTASAPALPDMLRLALSDPDSVVRGMAREALKTFHHSAAAMLPTIEAQLRAEDPGLRSYAVMALGALGEDAASLVPGLINMLLHDPSNDVAGSAARPIIQLGPTAMATAMAAVMAAAEAVLRGSDPEAIGRVLNPLVIFLGPSAAPLVEPLRACIRDPEFPRRTEAITTIGYFKSAAAPLLPDLRALLADSADERFAIAKHTNRETHTKRRPNRWDASSRAVVFCVQYSLCSYATSGSNARAASLISAITFALSDTGALRAFCVACGW